MIEEDTKQSLTDQRQSMVDATVRGVSGVLLAVSLFGGAGSLIGMGIASEQCEYVSPLASAADQIIGQAECATALQAGTAIGGGICILATLLVLYVRSRIRINTRI